MVDTKKTGAVKLSEVDQSYYMKGSRAGASPRGDLHDGGQVADGRSHFKTGFSARLSPLGLSI